MARREKPTSLVLELNPEQVEKIAEQMARVIGQELAKILSGINIPDNAGFKSPNVIKDKNSISIDESIIPVTLDTGIKSSNKKLGKEETSTDRELSDSKKKLADLFKSKGD